VTGPFPAGFRWGVSTSSYQIEGASTEDGRAPSIWDTFCAQPDTIADASTGEVACDHYHRYAQDAALMAELGAQAYRFSIAWPRVQPDGAGPVNPAGIGFYDRLVDTLLGHGIDPVATVFHWDLPQHRQDLGGWRARDTAYRFAEYAGMCARALGDRVKLWITLNEPAVHLLIGHVFGLHAPGLRLLDNPFGVAHHLLLAHGLAVGALRAHSASPVAVANSYEPSWAVGPDGRRESATDADRAAAAAHDSIRHRLFTDPILLGTYPDGLSGFAGADRLPGLVRDGDLRVIGTPIDALGVNYYNPAGIGAGSGPLPFDLRMIDGYPTTYFGWPVVPAGLTELLVGLRDRYRDALPPVYLTESGCAYDDRPDAEGSIVDSARVAYHEAHVRATADAIAAGVDVRGYFAWSLLDNFEWAEGYGKRFGLVYVDFATQARIPKASYHWYRELIASHRARVASVG
jgi:beta-glucosidase